MSGVLGAGYDAASIDEFARKKFVARVVSGTVTQTKVVVSQPGTEVSTLVTIEPDHAVVEGRKDDPVVTREPGGVVSVDEVREDFEGRVSAEVIDEHADDLIDYVDENRPHSVVGDRVLVFLARSTSGETSYFTAASMVATGDGSYEWPGGPPVDHWEKRVDAGHAARLVDMAK